MAMILALLGRDPRRGSGEYDGVLHRASDPRLEAQRRVERLERRLANYQRVRLSK